MPAAGRNPVRQRQSWAREEFIGLNIMYDELRLSEAHALLLSYEVFPRLKQDGQDESHLWDTWNGRFLNGKNQTWYDVCRPNSRRQDAYTADEIAEQNNIRQRLTAAAQRIGMTLLGQGAGATLTAPYTQLQVPTGSMAAAPRAIPIATPAPSNPTGLQTSQAPINAQSDFRATNTFSNTTQANTLPAPFNSTKKQKRTTNMMQLKSETSTTSRRQLKATFSDEPSNAEEQSKSTSGKTLPAPSDSRVKRKRSEEEPTRRSTRRRLESVTTAEMSGTDEAPTSQKRKTRAQSKATSDEIANEETPRIEATASQEPNTKPLSFVHRRNIRYGGGVAQFRPGSNQDDYSAFYPLSKDRFQFAGAVVRVHFPHGDEDIMACNPDVCGCTGQPDPEWEDVPVDHGSDGIFVCDPRKCSCLGKVPTPDSNWREAEARTRGFPFVHCKQLSQCAGSRFVLFKPIDQDEEVESLPEEIHGPHVVIMGNGEEKKVFVCNVEKCEVCKGKIKHRCKKCKDGGEDGKIEFVAI